MRHTPTLLAVIGALALLTGCDAFGARKTPACFKDIFEGQGYSLCGYDVGHDPESDRSGLVLHLAWKGPDGRPLGSLPALKKALGPEAGRVRFAMNAGMYHPDQRPVGLLVQDGKTTSPLETRPGEGNFYDLPNGVFWVDAAGHTGIQSTTNYASRTSPPAWATQSGPLLLDQGRLHPIVGRATRKAVRNAVGTCIGHGVTFVISDEPVTLGQLTRYLKDKLGCTDALYLDGAVSVLWSPDLKRLDDRKGLGPMLVVLERR